MLTSQVCHGSLAVHIGTLRRRYTQLASLRVFQVGSLPAAGKGCNPVSLHVHPPAVWGRAVRATQREQRQSSGSSPGPHSDSCFWSQPLAAGHHGSSRHWSQPQQERVQGALQHYQQQQASKSRLKKGIASSLPPLQTAESFSVNFPLARQHLSPGEVHVWWLQPHKVTDSSLLEQYACLLSTEERSYVAAAGSEKLRKERLLARTLVRTTLARYCPKPLRPEQLVLERSGSGKPQLVGPELACGDGPKRLHFNLSHTAGLIGCAVARGCAVGLDVEETARHTRADPLRLARRRFAPAEVSALEGIADETERAQHFVRLWTLKEAYLKALGAGIAARPGLRGFAVHLQPRSGSAGSSASNGSSAGSQRSPSSLHAHGAGPGDADGVLDIWLQVCSDDANPAAGGTGDEHGWEFSLFAPTAGHTAALCIQQLPQAGDDVFHTGHANLVSCNGSQPAADLSRTADCRVHLWETVPLSLDTPLKPQVHGSSISQ